mmetsp:Transcript_23389/g.32016  ORF Transcript_23389/g.32016 Transcript_23389/m.32016 type:complete len:126 (-) Transcript_23389:1184-1561(-)
MDSLMQPQKKKKKKVKKIQEEPRPAESLAPLPPAESKDSNPSFDKIYSTSTSTYNRLSEMSLLNTAPSLLNKTPFHFHRRFGDSEDPGSDFEDEMAIEMGKREVPLLGALSKFHSIQGKFSYGVV